MFDLGNTLDHILLKLKYISTYIFPTYIPSHPREYLNNLVKEKGCQMRDWRLLRAWEEYNPYQVSTVPVQPIVDDVARWTMWNFQCLSSSKKSWKPTWVRYSDAALGRINEAIIEW
jgi:hypothetical protein